MSGFRLVVVVVSLVASAGLAGAGRPARSPGEEARLRGGQAVRGGAREQTARLPRLALDVGRRRAGALFELARTNFEASFDPTKLRALLADAGDPTHPITAGQLATLKATRKDATILRSTFLVFDRKHRAPPAVDRYVRSFGQLNDALEAGARPELVARRAHVLLRQLDHRGAIDRDVARGFSPASRRSFDQHIAELFDRIDRSSARAVVSAREFHALRKDMKQILAVTQLMTAALPEQIELAQAFDHLKRLNDKLGTTHDRLAWSSVRGDASYDAATVAIPPELRTTVEDLITQWSNDKPAPK